MTGWQYLTIDPEDHRAHDGDGYTDEQGTHVGRELEDLLNHYGRQRWELVNVLDAGDDSIRCFFKRPINTRAGHLVGVASASVAGF